MLGWGHGHGIIMDKHYRVVRSIEPTSYQASSDMHEFMMLPDGKTVLMTQYLRSVENLCQYDICDGLGYVQQGAFQEVDIETGKALFEWRSLDHIDLDESYVKPGTTEISGSGKQSQSPWDYFHINSIDKNADGDYLISARHVSAIYKISGTDGHVMWRLNGARSDYRLEGFDFSFQHDARWVSDDKDKTVLTLFDNGSNGFNQTQPWSTGLMIEMDHNTKTAKLLRKYEPPELNGGRHISKSQGNYQALKNGNVLLGWGNDAFWTEYTENGTVAFYGSIGWRNVMNYRVHKFDNWVGLPLTKPALWTYSKTGADEMIFYVSWNGATEVKTWVFHTSDSKLGPWTEAGKVAKDGFETHHRISKTPKYAYVDALDKDGEWLGSSEVQQLYVPVEALQPFCDDMACQYVPTDEEKRRKKENEDREQRKAEEEKEAARKKARKRFMVLSESIGGTTMGVALIWFLATRPVLQRLFARVRLRLADLVAGQGRGYYRSLPLDEPMARSSALDHARAGTNRND